MEVHNDLIVFLCCGCGAVGSQDVLSPPFQRGNTPGAVTLSAAKAMASVPMGRTAAQTAFLEPSMDGLLVVAKRIPVQKIHCPINFQ